MAPLDRELLLSHALNKPREYFFTHTEKELSSIQVKKYNKLVNRRLKGEPIAYLTGKKEFYGLDFIVNKNVLIPRPETELLVEEVLRQIQNTRQRRGSPKAAKYKIPDIILDVGTGSGNIIISVIKNLPANARKKINFYATDISKKALFIAKKNARKHKILRLIKFIKSDLLKFIHKKKLEGNTIIIANLPYVSPQMYRKHKKNLRFEVKKALASEKNGLEYYIRLIREIREIVSIGKNKEVLILLEISPEQKKGILDIIQKFLPFSRVDFFRDLAGHWRVARVSISIDKKPL